MSDNFPSYEQFIQRWTAANEEQADARFNRICDDYINKFRARVAQQRDGIHDINMRLVNGVWEAKK